MGRPRKKTTNQVDAPAGSNELDVRWVMSNLSANPDQKLAPSPAAWEMYKIASVDEKSKSDFMKSVYAVVVRKEKPPEIGKTMSDDNRKFMRLFDLLEAEKPELLNEQFPRNADVAIDTESVVVGSCEVAANVPPESALVAVS